MAEHPGRSELHAGGGKAVYTQGKNRAGGLSLLLDGSILPGVGAQK